MPEEPPTTSPTTGAAEQTSAERLNAAVALLTAPSLDPAGVKQARDLIDTTYGALYQQLALDQADATAMGDLLEQRFEADRAALAAASAQGFNLVDNPLQVARIAAPFVLPVENNLQTLLGPANYVQYQIYAAPIRAAVVGALRQKQP